MWQDKLFSHFRDSKNETDKTHEKYDQLWKSHDQWFVKYYRLTERLVFEITVLVTGRIIFKQFK
jgi:hypothetical protein